MQPEVSEHLYLVNLGHSRDVDIETGISEPSWDEFKAEVMRHRIRDRKDGPGYIPVMTKLKEDWALQTSLKGTKHYRADVNIEALTVLVIDIDEPGALEIGEQIFEGYEYIVHSTHNFTPETPWKYRMIVRLAQPIEVQNWPACFESLKSRIDLDPSCCNPSRFYYYPSHSAASNIAPKSFHQKGRAITEQEILALGKDVVKKLRVSPLTSRTMGTLPLAQSRAKRHFSGGMVAHYDVLPQNVSQRMDSFMERHAKSIVDFELSPHSRHNFALSITSREYSVMGPRADMRRLLDLMFFCAARHGTPLESGKNTIEEIPGMLVTAMQKYAPEALDQAEADHGENFATWMAETIDKSLKSYEFAGFEDIKKAKVVEPVDMYSIMRERHKVLLREFISEGSLRRLVEQVLRHELANETPDYSNMANALYRYQYGYLTTVLKMPGVDAYGKLSADVKAMIPTMDPKELGVDEKKFAFARSALLVEIAKNKPAKPALEHNTEPGF
jgi:hypothetical protein